MPAIAACDDADISRYLLSLPYLSAICGDRSGRLFACALEEFSTRLALAWGTVRPTASMVATPGIVAELPADIDQGPADVLRPSKRAHLVVSHVSSASPELFWDAANYQERSGSEFYAAIDVIGRLDEVHIELRWPGGESSWLSVMPAASGEPDEQVSKMTKVVQIQLFVTHLVEASQVAAARRGAPNRLTDREAGVLALTLLGHSIWDLSQRLRMTDARVCALLNSAGQTLGSQWRHQSAVRALHLGWLDDHL